MINAQDLQVQCLFEFEKLSNKLTNKPGKVSGGVNQSTLNQT
jgi:hypothetical protein